MGVRVVEVEMAGRRLSVFPQDFTTGGAKMAKSDIPLSLGKDFLLTRRPSKQLTFWCFVWHCRYNEIDLKSFYCTFSQDTEELMC